MAVGEVRAHRRKALLAEPDDVRPRSAADVHGGAGGDGVVGQHAGQMNIWAASVPGHKGL